MAVLTETRTAPATEPPRTSRAPAVALACLFTVVTAWCATGIPVRATYGAQLTADEPQYLLSAISLAEDHNLDISDELAAERWRPFHSPARLPVQTKPLDGGRQLSPHDPLLPLLLAGPVAVGGWVGAKLAMAAMAGALAVLLVWIAIRRFDVPPPFAVAGVGVFALSPPLAVYGTQIYPELPGALAVAGAIALLTAPAARRSIWPIACVITALPWLSIKYVPVAAALTVIALWRTRSDRIAVCRFLGLLVVSGALYVIAHRLLYGGWTPYAAGDHFVQGEATVMGTHANLLGRSRRLVGLLVDRDFGLIPWQPAFLLALPAVASVTIRRIRHAPVLVAPVVAGWLTATFAALTMQGWWWPGRQIAVVLPGIVLATLWWAARTRRLRITLLVLGAIGVVSYAWLVVQGYQRDLTWVVDFMTTSNPLYRIWRPVLPNGRSSEPATMVRHLVWTIVALVTIAVTVTRHRRAGAR